MHVPILCLPVAVHGAHTVASVPLVHLHPKLVKEYQNTCT